MGGASTGVLTGSNSANRQHGLRGMCYFMCSYKCSIGLNAYTTLQFPSTIKSDGLHERPFRTIAGSVLDVHVTQRKRRLRHI